MDRRVTSPMIVVVRTKPGTRVNAAELRAIAQGIGPQVFIDDIVPASHLVADTVARPRHRTLLFSLLGGLGPVLTLVGIFGATAYAVARRTQEIGVRMAFGASPRRVVRTIVMDAARPVVIGTVIGLGVAMLSTKVIAKFLFQTTPTDPATFAAVSIVLGVAGVLAAWLPARRAARVDPISALRSE
jgi:ABC-type antimicrobial peptide transport system permease subunit